MYKMNYAIVFLATFLSHTQWYTLPKDISLIELAHQFATTTQQLQQYNTFKTDQLKARQKVKVPTQDMIVVQPGDTLASILKRHHISKAQLAEWNDHIDTLVPQRLLAKTDVGLAHMINPSLTLQPQSNANGLSRAPHNATKPVINDKTFINTYHNDDAKLTELLKPTILTPVSTVKSPNLYVKGQCTHFVFEERQKRNRPIPNYWGDAKNWLNHAKKEGYNVNHTPEVGAILTSQIGAHGHVAIVTSIALDNSYMIVKEMNWIGEGIVSERKMINPDQYLYIHD